MAKARKSSNQASDVKQLNDQHKAQLENLRAQVDQALAGAEVNHQVRTQVDKLFQDAGKQAPSSPLQKHSAEAKKADMMAALPGRPSVPRRELYERPKGADKQEREAAKKKVQQRGAQGEVKGLRGQLQAKAQGRSKSRAKGRSKKSARRLGRSKRGARPAQAAATAEQSAS